MSARKKKILFYCQHSLGMGHLVRSFALANSLSSEFRVILLNGGKLPKKLQVPPNIEIVNLPPLGFDENNQLVSRDGRRSVDRAQSLRQKVILDQYDMLKPHVVLIELFPFGRKKFANELLPLLGKAQGKSKVVCSLRDILVSKRQDQRRHDERAIETANLFFDAILVHADEDFVRVEDSFQTDKPLNVPVFYTGFVAPELIFKTKAPSKKTTQKHLLVSAGGGVVGENLFRAVIEAHKILSKCFNLKTTIVGGPFLTKNAWQSLRQMAADNEHIQFRRFVPDLPKLMRKADISVSQCGYNTALDILSSGVSALVVPFGDSEGEDEQTKRAGRFAEKGLLRVCKGLEPDILAIEIEKTIGFKPQKCNLNLDGGKNSTLIVRNLLNKADEKKSWLDPVKSALEKKSRPVKIFFRDDDAGIGNSRLFNLIEIFKKHKVHLDIAVIPNQVTAQFAKELRSVVDDNLQLFAIHQHGFAHVNHETDNRNCEFGPARNRDQQMRDINDGQKVLGNFFGDLPEPIFTPPWNRCTEQTGAILRELGFEVLSRENKAEPLEVDGLHEIPVSVDWFAKYKGIALSRKQIGKAIAHAIVTQDYVGIMLHHASMDAEELKHLSELLDLFSSFRQVETHSIWSLFTSSKKKTAAHV